MNKKELADICRLFTLTAKSKPVWQIWSDFIEMYAIAISNSMDLGRYERREERYIELSKGYTEEQMKNIQDICVFVVDRYNRKSDQDLLGTIYMTLKLESHWKGQFFSPYEICRLNAEIAGVSNMKYYTLYDSCCGSGANLIAKINEFKNQNIDFQNKVLVIGQDADYITALMCYIQLSVLGCSAVVKVGDTLERPISKREIYAGILTDNEDLWYSPKFIENAVSFLGGQDAGRVTMRLL